MSEDLRALAGLVQGASGIALRDVQLDALRAALHRVDPQLEPTELLHDDDRVRQARRLERLVDEVTVNETFFLRHIDELVEIDWIAAVARAAAAGRRAARVWSAACATGEEPYSLALLAAEALRTVRPAIDVLATDISATALAGADRAVYGERSLRLLDRARRKRWCVTDHDGVRVGEQLRELVRFARHNLVRDPLPPVGEAPFDVIVCRNVLIYFDRPTVARVVAALEGALAPGGMLLLGTADRLGSALPKPRARAAPVPRPGRPRTPPAPHTSGERTRTAETPQQAAHAAFETGLRLLSDGEAAVAVQALRRALYLDPAFAVAALQLARGHEALREVGAARRAYWRALRLAEDAPSPEARLYGRVGAADVIAACRARLAALVDA
ncbi:MAG: methyltransferase, CheR-type [Conexibacter sp.]|nr:methyltransferase, CheR-type [Conexibacter sp.]